ncbi:MAG: B12-binding domain-containing protein, partial [Rickettsiales bacterium]
MTIDTPYIPKKPAGTVDDPYDPLQYFIALFEGRKGEASSVKQRADTIEGVLKDRIIDGDKKGLEDDLAIAMKTHAPLFIINDILLAGMKVVGELFGSGKMQLPFVLQSAETMKKAVAYLEQFMEKVEGQEKGKIVLATVKGDVHDIGKNLVDIILTNNGFKVYNLGIKQPIDLILKAVDEVKPDAIGLSGLLVKSTVVMRENLADLTSKGINIPVLLGGAALTRAYVEEDCVEAYGAGRVAYAQDAFDGLDLMNKIAGGQFDSHLEDIKKRKHNRPSSSKAKQRWSQNEEAGQKLISVEMRPVEWEAIKLKRAELAAQVAVPNPPFWGAKIVDSIPVKALIPYLNEQMLFTFHWGFKKAGKTLDEYWKWVDTDVRPILKKLLAECESENILQPKAAYGFFKCASSGNSLLIFDESGKKQVGQLDLPRQDKDGGICVADFFRDVDASERDVLAMQVVTAGQTVADVARQWFENNRYQDYLY